MKKNLHTFKLIIGFFLAFLIFPFQGFTQRANSPENNNSKFLPGQIVIKVKEGIGPFEKQDRSISFDVPSLDETAAKFEIKKLEKRFKHKPIPVNSDLPDLSRIYRIEFPSDIDVHQVAREFSKDPNIEYAEAIPINMSADVPDDPMYNSQQHLPQIMAAEAWDIHKGEDGDEIIVAIVDSGVDWLHTDLIENCWQNLGEDADGDGVTLEFNDGIWERDPDDLNGVDDDGNGYIDDVIGWDFWEAENVGNGSNPDPFPHTDLHGTHCTGIAAARTNNGVGISSVSHNITYMPTKIDNGANSFIYAYQGIIYAAENGADIINNSWGGPSFSAANQEVIDYAVGLGSIVVVCAHNYNTDEPYYPAAYHGAIAVSALNSDDTRAGFSNYGAWLDIAAPGVDILSTYLDNNYGLLSGTSMATPMVVGLLALLKSYQPTWTNDQLVEQVIGSVDNIDDLNPGYEKALGSGRINAYHALVDENVEVPQELKLEFIDFTIEDEDGDGAIAAGETGTISITMRNYAHLVSDENATFSLSSVDPDIIMTTSSTAAIPADAVFEVTNAFEFTVAEGAQPHYADFIITVSSDMPVIYGSESEIEILVAPSGFFVWDGKSDMPDYSGTFISDFLLERGYPVIYTSEFPASFSGFSAIFLSFGNPGSGSIILTDQKAEVIINYLESGGYLYIEGGDAVGFDQAENLQLLDMLGVESGIDGIENPIDKLAGQTDALTREMVFSSNHQTSNSWIDIFEINDNGIAAFIEDGYGIVGVQNYVPDAHRTFCSSYALAYLDDEDPYSSRYNLMLKIMEHFGFVQGNSDVVANFSVDKTEGTPDFEVQFTDWSITNNDSEITSYAWDFNEDGIYDSYEQNPVWTYTEGGVFDVKLIAYSNSENDTLIKKDLITVRSGILVYEGKPNENGYSGTFINEYLHNNSYEEVGYTNNFPSTLAGYDAVFLSYGNTGARSSELSSDMTTKIFNYVLSGGNIYVEGGDVMNLLGSSYIWAFGLSAAEMGSANNLTELKGQEEAITDGLQFNNSNQLSVRSIDTYSRSESFPGAVVAFEESDYGTVGVQFDGSAVNGQKTFCLSYALADLVDGEGMNTRNELLQRILNFFEVTVGVEEQAIEESIAQLKVYPNPASDHLTLEFLLETDADAIVEIFELSGRKISEEIYPSQTGTQRIRINVNNYSSGIYYIRVQAGKKVETIKWIKVD